MTPARLYEMQLELECKRLLSSGRLQEIPCENPDGLALISVVRFLDGGGDFIRLREDADDQAVEVAARLSVDDLLHAEAPGASAGVALIRHFSGRTGTIDVAPPAVDWRGVDTDDGRWIVRVGGIEVAAAFSARENAAAAELSVETATAHRRRGYGRQVAAAWAAGVLGCGRVAFYSYDFANSASAALAASLGVQPQFEVGSFDIGTAAISHA